MEDEPDSNNSVEDADYPSIIERIEESTFVCGSHGELETDELGLGYDGQIICSFCAINIEMDLNNELDIDPSVKVKI